MGFVRLTGALAALAVLAGCDTTSLNAQAYPGRTQVSFMSADQVTLRTYACTPAGSERATQAKAARAHQTLDAGIRSAYRRFGGQEGQGFVNNLGAQAEVNAEINRVARQVEAEYRCALLNSKDTSRTGLFAG